VHGARPRRTWALDETGQVQNEAQVGEPALHIGITCPGGEQRQLA
jgi:hypothetical protein